MIISRLIAIGVIGATVAASSAALAQYPERQVGVIVPFEAGGGSDAVARLVDRYWTEETGQGFNFQYQPGAAGAVGTDAIARASADGYTVGIVNLPNMVVQPISGAASFSVSDFEYIGQVNADPIVLMVPDSSPYQTIEEFVAAASEAPGTLTLAITGTLGAAHLVALQMMDLGDMEVTLVPTQGGANTVARIAGGHVSAGLIGLGLYTGQENGRALAVTATDRSEFAPDVPTFAESGFDIDIATSRIYVAPEGIPDEALNYLRETLEQVTLSEEFAAASREQGQDPVWRAGDELETYVTDLEPVIRRLMEQYDLI